MAMTIKKIAELAGVSAGTVDRALNNRKGVKKEVAERIKEIAKSVGYVPNAAAKGLVARRKELKFGIIIHTQQHEFIKELLRGIEDATNEIKDYGVSILLKTGEDWNVDSQLEKMDELVEEGIQGLAIIPLNDVRVEAKIEELQKKGIKVVLMVSDLDNPNICYVGVELYRSGRVLAGITGLISRGKNKILYCTSPLSLLGNTRRLAGFRDGLVDYQNCSLAGVYEFPNDDVVAYGEFMRYASEYQDVDVIILATGKTKGIYQAISEIYFQKEVVVIALDLSDTVKQGLNKRQIKAVVCQHPYRQGKEAMQLLFRSIVMGVEPENKKNYVSVDIRIHESLF